MHICLPITIKSDNNNNNNNIPVRKITVNNFFARWLKEVDIKDMVTIFKFYLLEIKLKYVDILMQCSSILMQCSSICQEKV